MIPSVVARQVRETVLDYLRTTFALADPEFERALFDFLDSDDGLFKGPYVAGFHARPNYDVRNDGKRFVMVDGGAGLTQRRLKIHLNLTREIEEKLRK